MRWHSALFIIAGLIGVQFSIRAEALTTSPWSPNSHYQWDILDTSKRLFLNQPYRFSWLPSNFTGLRYLRTDPLDKTATGGHFLNFNAALDVIVYLAHDKRIGSKPGWLQNWTDTGHDLWATSGTVFDVYQKTFPAGQVSIGGNGGDETSSMYSVFIQQDDFIPLAINDSTTTKINTSIAVEVLANDQGLDDGPIDVSVVTAALNGWLQKRSDNSILYYPKYNFIGEDRFSYRIQDADGDASFAAVSVTVGAQQTGDSGSSGSSSGGRILTISWSHSQTDMIDGYILLYGSAPWDATKRIAKISSRDRSIDPSTPSIQLHSKNDLGLEEGERVCFKARAYNANGVSLPSTAACTQI